MNPEDQDGFREILPTINVTTGSNPRATIRFVNNVLINRAINQALSDAGDMEPIPIGFFAVTRILQQRYEDVFNLLLNAPRLARRYGMLENDEPIPDSILNDSDGKTFIDRLNTDKVLTGILCSNYGRDWLRDRIQRTASVAFLRGRQEPKISISVDTQPIDLFVISSPNDKKIVDNFVAILVEEKFRVVQTDETVFSHESEDSHTRFLGTATSSKGIMICIGSDPEMYLNTVSAFHLASLSTRDGKRNFSVIPLLLPGFKNSTSMLKRKYITNHLDARKGLTQQIIDRISRAIQL